jgi:hypothetical protein
MWYTEHLAPINGIITTLEPAAVSYKYVGSCLPGTAHQDERVPFMLSTDKAFDIGFLQMIAVS